MAKSKYNRVELQGVSNLAVRAVYGDGYISAWALRFTQNKIDMNMEAKSYEEIYDISDAGLVSTGSGMTDLQVAAAAGLGSFLNEVGSGRSSGYLQQNSNYHIRQSCPNIVINKLPDKEISQAD